MGIGGFDRVTRSSIFCLRGRLRDINMYRARRPLVLLDQVSFHYNNFFFFDCSSRELDFSTRHGIALFLALTSYTLLPLPKGLVAVEEWWIVQVKDFVLLLAPASRFPLVEMTFINRVRIDLKEMLTEHHQHDLSKKQHQAAVFLARQTSENAIQAPARSRDQLLVRMQNHP